jgi:DNA-binding transcriptional LysR family regulator
MAHPHLEQIHKEAEEAKRRAKSLLNVGRTSLKLGIMCTITPSQFVKLIDNFRKRNPKVSLQILDRNAEQLQAALLSGELEVAIYGQPGETSDEKLHKLPLFKEKMVIALPKGHPLCRNTQVKVSELDGEPYLERTNCEFAQYGEKVFAEKGVGGADRVRERARRLGLGDGCGWHGLQFFARIHRAVPRRRGPATRRP